MITGKTKSGFEFHLEEDALDDYELLENLCKIDNGKESLIITVAKQLLGEEQHEALKEHLRSETGRVSAVKMGKEIGEILAGVNQGKN